MLVDDHCHLYHEKYKDDFDQVLERARKAGVHMIINSGVNHSTNLAVLEQAKKYPDIIRPSLGIYPVDAVVTEADLQREIEPINIEEELSFIKVNKNRIIAIGECGLDYHIIKGKEKEQQDVFQRVIELAEKIKKPLVVHSRKAESDVLDMIESSRLKNVVLHSFMPNLKIVKRAADLGCTFSIPTIIARLQHFQLLVEMVSLQNILTETDGPFLSAYKDGRSEPAHIIETIKIISQIKKIEREETEKIIFSNFQKIFLKK